MSQTREFFREGPVEDVVGEVEVSERGHGGQRWRNGARERVRRDGEVREGVKEGNGWGEGAGEVEAGEVEGDDGASNAGDTRPVAVVQVGVP